MHSFASVLNGVGTNVTGTENVQASTVVERDANSDVYFNTAFASKGLHSAGHLYVGYLAKSSTSWTNDETTNNATIYGASTGNSNRTVTLEAAATVTNKLIIFTKTDSGTGALVFDTNGSETLGGSLSHVLLRQYDRLIAFSDGSNYHIINEPTVVAASVAASTAITAGTEGTFDTSGVSIPADSLRAGEILEIEAQVRVTATTGSETTNIKLKLGTTVIVATGAIDVANDDIAYIRATIQIRTIGATGTIVAAGVAAIGTGGASSAIGSLTSKPFFLASTTIDTTAAATVNVTCTNSSTGESARLDLFVVKRFRN